MELSYWLQAGVSVCLGVWTGVLLRRQRRVRLQLSAAHAMFQAAMRPKIEEHVQRLVDAGERSGLLEVDLATGEVVPVPKGYSSVQEYIDESLKNLRGGDES